MDEHTMQCQECGTIHRIYNVCPVCEHRARSKQYSFDDCDWDSTQKALKMVEEQCDLVKVMSGANEARTYRKR